MVIHPDNQHNVSTLDGETLALDVGFHLRGRSSKTLAVIGRGIDADIYVEGSDIAKIQCSFEIDLEAGIVMLYDRSFAKSTQVFGENAMPFERGRNERKVLVQDNLNTVIGMGGQRRDLIQFKLKWHRDPQQMLAAIKHYDAFPYGRVENPRLARTENELPTALPSRFETRVHTPGQGQLKMRYIKVVGGQLGSGQFGTVHKAINVDSGKLMAVKILERPSSASKQEEWRRTKHYAFKREVETLSNMNHAHIVDYIASQGWEELQIEIFMGLKEGTFESLITSKDDPFIVVSSVFPQMLQALDFIACQGIVHRDVKPANILYVSQSNGQYEFQLGDFGLCNRIIDAVSFVGTYLYMAPEVSQNGSQTHKVDVWSLFVSMMWALNTGGFRQRSHKFKSDQEIHQFVSFAASQEQTLSTIREMARFSSEERASAAQMLVKNYNGVGLSTRLSKVPPLNASPFTATTTTINVSTPVYSMFTSQPAQTGSRARQKNKNKSAPAGRSRVKKPRRKK